MMGRTGSLDGMTAEIFLPYVQPPFSVIRSDRAASSVTLTEVKQSQCTATVGRQQFSLDFLDTPGEVLPQRMYLLSHAAMGALEIFIVPVGSTAEGTFYEAVFA